LLLVFALARVPKPSFDNPILVMGFGKCGTSSLFQFFRCGGFKVSHYICERQLCGMCVARCMAAGKKPLECCGDYDIHTQFWSVRPPNCSIPQVFEMEAIHKAYPKSTWILNTRPTKHWIRSQNAYTKDWRQRWLGCTNRTFLPEPTDEHFARIYVDHLRHVREFWMAHRQHQAPLVEVNIESPYAAAILHEAFGVPKKCWGDYNSVQNQTDVILSEDLENFWGI